MGDPVQQFSAAMARAAAAAPFDPYAQVRERLAQLLSDGPMNGAALAEAYQRAFRAQLAQVAQNFGARNLRELLLTHAPALGVVAEKTGGGSAGNVWVRLASGTNGASSSAPRATPSPAGPLKPPVGARHPPEAPEVPVERRYDTDGGLYTKAEFIGEYGSTAEWDAAAKRQPASAARVVPPPAAHQGGRAAQSQPRRAGGGGGGGGGGGSRGGPPAPLHSQRGSRCGTARPLLPDGGAGAKGARGGGHRAPASQTSGLIRTGCRAFTPAAMMDDGVRYEP